MRALLQSRFSGTRFHGVKTSALFLAMAMTFVGCGGGGGGGDSGGSTSSGSTPSAGGGVSTGTNPTTGEQDWVTTGTVSDKSTGQPIEAAFVDVPLTRSGGSATQNFNTTSNAAGAYSLRFPKSVPLPKFFTGNVNKTGYLPGTIFYSFSGTSLTTDNGSENVQLTPKTEADVVFAKALSVVHLGDGTFSGMPNSQLQVPKSGPALSDTFELSASQKQQYTKLSVTMYARGVESTSKNYCDKIELRNLGTGTGAGAQTFQETDATGKFTSITHEFPLDQIAAGTVELVISAGPIGACSGTGEIDDFEFVSIVGHLS
jgi:hypothetical protein